ncbi:Mss4-like protein, partial [Leptodontidium sp. MPI-SDFR-AT-0119]
KQSAKRDGCQDAEIDGEENEWKFRAPYRIHTNEDFKAVYEGGCHCGKVRYQLGRERPVKSKFCHCGTCRRLHGAPFQHAAIFHKEDINFLKGHHNLRWYDSTEKTTRHKLPCKVSCEYCGSWIMDEGWNMILLFPGLLDLKEGEGERFKAECHMFYADRMVDVNDGLPKWSGMQGESELIADSPSGAVKKRKREVEEEE